MRNRLVVLSLTVVAVPLLVGACAKRPAISLLKAPSPMAETREVTPPPTPPPPAPVTPAPPPVAVAPEPAPRVMGGQFMPNRNVKPIYFAFDQAVVRPGDAKILDTNAVWLKENPGYVVLIEGHCDERGTEQYNLALG